jgi:hypothetical protein
VTPGERDEVRQMAAELLSAAATYSSVSLPQMCAAILRYVPPGDAAAPSPWRVRHDGCGMVAITFDALVVAMEPDAARRLAHAMYAAADAAEED